LRACRRRSRRSSTRPEIRPFGQRNTARHRTVCQQPPGCAERTIRRSPAVTATRSTRLSHPWQRHSEPGAAARSEAVVARPGPTRLDVDDRDTSRRLRARTSQQARSRSCVGTHRIVGRRDPDHRAVAWPGGAVISSLPTPPTVPSRPKGQPSSGSVALLLWGFRRLLTRSISANTRCRTRRRSRSRQSPAPYAQHERVEAVGLGRAAAGRGAARARAASQPGCRGAGAVPCRGRTCQPSR
jgi:hypothetical protein